jgi:hypothetical protein
MPTVEGAVTTRAAAARRIAESNTTIAANGSQPRIILNSSGR